MGFRVVQATVLGAALVAAHAAPSAAQVYTGRIDASVSDTTGAVLPGVTVDISGPQKETGVTDALGHAHFLNLAPGVYAVSAKLSGFNNYLNKNVPVGTGTSVALAISMSVGGVASEVEVTSAAPVVDTKKMTTSTNVSLEELQNIPTARDPWVVMQTVPGIVLDRVNVGGGESGQQPGYQAKGASGSDNTWNMDGIAITDMAATGSSSTYYDFDMFQEMQVTTGGSDPQNPTPGVQLNMVLKSGTNTPHGSLYIFERDTALTANDYFSKQSGNPTPPISRQQYGGSVGAPIKKDQTFVFFALERAREETSLGVTGAAQKELGIAASSIPGTIKPTVASIIPTPYRDQRYTGRLDHKINSNNNFFVTWNSQGNRGLNDQSGQTNDLTAGNFTTNQLILANATLTSVLRPNIVNSFTFGHQYWNNLIDSDNKVPQIAFPNSIYFGTNTNVPQQSSQRKWQFKEDLSITKGKHTLQAGVDFVHEPKLGGFFQTPSTLNITFLDLPSVITTNTAKYPQGFSTPGAIGSMSASSGNPYFFDRSAKMLGFYFQDNMKLSRKFSLNVGARWDADYNLQGGNVQAQSRTYLALKAVNSPWAGKLPKNDLNNVSPRIGFAYDLTGKGNHVIRGGWGVYYGQTFQNIPLFMEQQANNTVFTQTLSISSAGPTDTTSPIVPGTTKHLNEFSYGVDPLPPIPPGSPALTAGAVGRLVDPDFANPYNHQFNAGYTWQIDSLDVVEVEYVHVLGLREAKRQNINYQQPDQGGARPFDAAFTAAGLPKLAQIVVESSIGRSRYDGLNISYRRRLNRRFSINTNYVLSRALAYVGGPAAFGNAAPIPTIIFPSYDLGPAPNDETHRWVFSGILQLPGGIQLAPIMQLASARPYSATQGVTWTSAGSGNGTTRAVVLNSDPTNLRATKDLTAQQIRDGIAAGTMHEVPYNSLRGQAFYQLDLRVSKFFKFRERHRLEFVSQFFNLTNRANFGGNYNTSIRTDTFGTPAGYFAPGAAVVPKSFAAELAVQYRF